MITIDRIGTFEHDSYGMLICQKTVRVPALGIECRFILEGYENDPRQTDFHEAMIRFVTLSRTVLRAASGHVFEYYHVIRESGWGDPPDIPDPARVWDFVEFGRDPVVSRRDHGDHRIYISLECECAWEPEHGLQIVFRDGGEINKIGPFDGHLTNSDAFADSTLENTVYAR